MSDSEDNTTDPFLQDWSSLPHPIIAQVFSHLGVVDRCRAALTCTHWRQCLEIPFLWRRFKCTFNRPSDASYVRCLRKYARYVRDLSVEVDQGLPENRQCALEVMNILADLTDIQLTHLLFTFTGENPLFYSGQELTSSIRQLFEVIGKSVHCSLKYLNLRGLEVNLEAGFMISIALNLRNLEYLNLLNKTLVCNVSPDSLSNVIRNCQKLRVLHVYHASLSSDVINILAEPSRQPLIRLGVVCRREEKYGEDITRGAWINLNKKSPGLTVELGFDHTCPLHRVGEIIKPEIPVKELHLATFSRIYPEVRLVPRFYSQTLTKLVVHSRPSDHLDEALLEVARHCKLLDTLYVFCVVKKEVVREILELCPALAKNKTCILKSEIAPEPWTVGQEEGD